MKPSNIDLLRQAGARGGELKTFARLGRQLPGEFTVFHSVRWLRAKERQQIFGEVDFVVVNQAGDVLLIEQKDGPLEEGGGDLVKRYSDRPEPKSVVNQMYRAREGLIEALAQYLGKKGRVTVNHLLFCPHHRLQHGGVAGLPAEAIVDATGPEELADKVQKLLGPGKPDRKQLAKAVRDFLSQELDLAPDLRYTADEHYETYQRLSGGLTETIKRIHMEPWRLHVQASAGSGKTQAAVEFFEQEEQMGRRVALVCFNRPLADRLRERLPGRDSVDNFHALCRRWLEGAGETFDSARAGAGGKEASAYWGEVIERLIELVDWLPQYDTIIVDEGQDFEPEWWELLRLFVPEEGRILWLSDPEQDLYGRNPVPLEGMVTYTAPVSYRTPKGSAALWIESSPRGLTGGIRFPDGLPGCTNTAGPRNSTPYSNNAWKPSSRRGSIWIR